VGYEVWGVIEHVGSGVTTLAAGDRVVAMTNFRGHAEIVCVSISQVVKLPAMVSFEAAAALPVNYLTARRMLATVARVRAGETVLVHMAAGGVGLALLQLCRNIGSVRVIGTASQTKHDVLHRNGCVHAIDYRLSDYASEV